MDDQKLISDIASDVQDLDAKVRDIAAASQRRYRMGIPAGQTVRSFGEYEAVDADGRAKVRAACQGAYDAIVSDLDRHISAANRTMSAPASADDVATVHFTLARENVTRDELQGLLDRYRGNYQLAAGITERAHQGGIFLDGEPESVRVFRDDALTAAGQVFNRYNPNQSVFSARILADTVVGALRHVDALGRMY